MAKVSGDNWHHGWDTPYVEGIEYFNYTDFDITITDKLGVECEVLRSDERPARLEDRGKVIIRVTRLIDPRRVRVPSTDAQLAADRMYLESFKAAVDHARENRIGAYESEHNQIRVPCQAEIRLDFYLQNTVAKSNLLGITIRATNNIVDKSHGNTPEGYINDIMMQELKEVDEKADGGTDKGIRTLFSARLIDNHNRVGTLWTTGFGEVTRIIPVKDEEQAEGLYLAGGLGLEHKEFIPIEELIQPKRMLGLNIHRTEIDARKFGLGEYTITVMTERDKIRKECKDLRTENKKLASKIDELESRSVIDKINKAHSDFKHAVTTENLKENNVNNALGGISRLISLVVTNIKTFISFASLLRAM